MMRTSTLAMNEPPVIRMSGASGEGVLFERRLTVNSPRNGVPSHSTRRLSGHRDLDISHERADMDLRRTRTKLNVSEVEFDLSQDASARKRRGSTQPPVRVVLDRQAITPWRSGTDSGGTSTGPLG